MKHRKIFLVLLMISISVVAFAQENMPFRVGVGIALSNPTIAMEYAFPLGNMSMGVEAGFSTYISMSGGEIALRWYPFSNLGKGLNVEAGYGLLLSDGYTRQNGGAVVGYRFIFWKHVTVNIGIGYEYMYTPNDGALRDQVVAEGITNTRLTIGAAF